MSGSACSYVAASGVAEEGERGAVPEVVRDRRPQVEHPGLADDVGEGRAVGPAVEAQPRACPGGEVPAGRVAERDDRTRGVGGHRTDRGVDVVEGRGEAAAVADPAVLHVGRRPAARRQVLGQRRAVVGAVLRLPEPAVEDDDQPPAGAVGDVEVDPLARVVAVGDPLGFAGHASHPAGRLLGAPGQDGRHADRPGRQPARRGGSGGVTRRARSPRARSARRGRAAPSARAGRSGAPGRDPACGRPTTRRGRRSPARSWWASSSVSLSAWSEVAKTPLTLGFRLIAKDRSTTWCSQASLLRRNTSTAALPPGASASLLRLDR